MNGMVGAIADVGQKSPLFTVVLTIVKDNSYDTREKWDTYYRHEYLKQ